MTNLDIIKYLATNNPARLAKLLNDIYDVAYTDGYNDDIDAWPNFEKWLGEDASKCRYYYDYELEEWSETINPTSTLVAFYGTESKVINQAIDEIELLETLVKEN